MAREPIHYPDGQPLPGTKYKVVRKLGQGGMGVVFEVVKDPGIRAVIKIIHPKLAAEAEFRRRFFDEVRILARLDHPNIVRVTDYDQLADGTPYFAMELLSGSTVRQAVQKAGAVQPLLLHQIMLGLLEGLEYVHSHEPSIVHRDVKSDNVFIHVPSRGDPCVKVIDFGVAGGDSVADKEGIFVGTARYAAPEQIRGEKASPKVDLYAAGLMLYEGLTGRGPFDDVELVDWDRGDRQRAFVRAHLSLPAPSIRTFAPWVPEMIDELLQSALSKDPADRPVSAAAFAQRLYMLQFLGDAPLGINTTAQTLVTMVTASHDSDGPPVASEAPAPRPARSPLNDTHVDTRLPFGMQDAAPNSSAPTVVAPAHAAPLHALETDPTPISPPVEPSEPRSFGEAEAAREKRSSIPAPAWPTPSRLDRRADPGLHRSVGPPRSRQRVPAVLGLVIAIPLTTGLAFLLARTGPSPAPAAVAAERIPPSPTTPLLPPSSEPAAVPFAATTTEESTRENGAPLPVPPPAAAPRAAGSTTVATPSAIPATVPAPRRARPKPAPNVPSRPPEDQPERVL